MSVQPGGLVVNQGKSTQRGPSSTQWDLEPHTAAKHELIRRYLNAWFPILSTYSGRVIFLDGFAGPGVYSNGQVGSPVIALQTLLDHGHLQRMRNCEFLFVFMEPERDRAASLQQVLEDFVAERGGLPSNVKYSVVEQTFREGAEEILAELESQKAQLAPMFAFIDPFGYSHVPLDVISRLLNYDRCEVFFNFNYDHINRFATAGNVDHHLREIFGCDDYLAVGECKSPVERREFLHDLYERQLNDVANFPFVQQFAMYNRGGHNIYSLFFGTRHVKGVDVMKDAMWRVDPGNGNVFFDRLAGEDVLFQPEPNFGPLREALLREFRGRTVAVEDIHQFVVVNTPYAGSHWNRKVLNPLEKEGLVEVITSPRLKRFTFPPGTVVHFKP